jgi:predicted TPR repeat methyltransferase
MSEKAYLSKVYNLKSSEAVRDYYDAWSDSYDNELMSQGYATPGRCAAALLSLGVPLDASILDFGCGTGVSGTAFQFKGFANLHGCDLSVEMLAKAKAKGIYSNTFVVPAGAALPGGYDVVAAVGVIGAGSAPPEAFDAAIAAVKPSGLFVWSYNDHALEDPRFPAKIDEHIAKGAKLVFQEHGPHIPGIGLSSTVYVLKT